MKTHVYSRARMLVQTETHSFIHINIYIHIYMHIKNDQTQAATAVSWQFFN